MDIFCDARAVRRGFALYWNCHCRVSLAPGLNPAATRSSEPATPLSHKAGESSAPRETSLQSLSLPSCSAKEPGDSPKAPILGFCDGLGLSAEGPQAEHSSGMSFPRLCSPGCRAEHHILKVFDSLFLPSVQGVFVLHLFAS